MRCNVLAAVYLTQINKYISPKAQWQLTKCSCPEVQPASKPDIICQLQEQTQMGNFHKAQVMPCVLWLDGQALAGMLKGKQRCSYSRCDSIVMRHAAHHQQMFHSCRGANVSDDVQQVEHSPEGHDAGSLSEGSCDVL